jgi:hypothetical protein
MNLLSPLFKAAFYIAQVVPVAFDSTLPCTGSPASRAIAKSKMGRLGPSGNNWKFRGHKADTQVEKRCLGHPSLEINARATRPGETEQTKAYTISELTPLAGVVELADAQGLGTKSRALKTNDSQENVAS